MDMQNMRPYTFAERRGRQCAAWCLAFSRPLSGVFLGAALLSTGVLFAAMPALPTAPAPLAVAEHFTVHGARDGEVPAWTISAMAPSGWTADCCTYAKAIGVNFVLYRGEWTGKPQQVMVLNVWPRTLPTLTAEIQADRTHYLQTDPGAKVSPITIHHPALACQATLYQGSDHIDDIVVFCSPAKASISTSMPLRAATPMP